ncbi:MAG: hypothetical protein HYU69_02650 [Bacteroidetes bacterium]|nr:hypothetical protein [Bacteroidota bacterium]
MTRTINKNSTSDSLFELIRSLNPTEKRYIKVLMSKNSGRSYEKLFDVINKQKIYNEWETKRKLRNETYIRQLARIKNYLYEFIVAGLNTYHASFSPGLVLKRYLTTVEILFRKKLFVQCKKYLQKAKKLALRYNEYTALLEILNWERSLMDVRVNIKKRMTDLDTHIIQEENVLKKISRKNQYRNLYFKAYWLMLKEGVARGHNGSGEMEKIIKHPFLTDTKNIVDVSTRIMYFEIQAFYRQYAGNFPQAYNYRKKLIGYFTEDLLKIPEYVLRYKMALHNFLVISSYLSRYDSVYNNLLDQLKALSKNNGLSDVVKKEIPVAVFAFQTAKYIGVGKFRDAIHLIENDFDGLRPLIKADNELIQFYGLFFTCYFTVSNYSKALFWLNKIINYPHSDHRKDVLCLARILNIITHYEKGNYDLIENLTQSTRRYFIRVRHHSLFEDRVLEFFKNRMYEIKDEDEQIRVFIDLKKDLTRILKKAKEKLVLDYFDFISWLESKIENRPLIEVVIEKAKIVGDG